MYICTCICTCTCTCTCTSCSWQVLPDPVCALENVRVSVKGEKDMCMYRNLPILRTLFELQCVFFLVQNVLPIFFDSSKYGRGFRLAIQIIEIDGFGSLGQFKKKKKTLLSEVRRAFPNFGHYIYFLLFIQI